MTELDAGGVMAVDGRVLLGALDNADAGRTPGSAFHLELSQWGSDSFELKGLQAITMDQRVPGQEPMPCPWRCRRRWARTKNDDARGQHCNFCCTPRALERSWRSSVRTSTVYDRASQRGEFLCFGLCFGLESEQRSVRSVRIPGSFSLRFLRRTSTEGCPHWYSALCSLDGSACCRQSCTSTRTLERSLCCEPWISMNATLRKGW
ncbi:hypothetical protein V8C42DRAFT_320586 [Trichoderma barbatum]